MLPYSLFEAFLFRYLERFICLDDSAHLFKGFRLFHLLLLYFDPQLAQHLNEQDFPPELYSPQWFLTLYSRSMPLPHVLRLWDMMIAVDDPSFTFFIGMCLVRRRRTELLLSDRDRIPEIIVKMQFHGEEEIDAIVKEASEGKLKGILGFNSKPLVSIDFNHDPHSSVYDSTLTQVMGGTLVKVCSWYDNEWGFSNRMLDTTLALMAAK